MKKIKIIAIVAATVLVLGAAATTVAVLVNRDDIIRPTELKVNLLDSPMGVPKENLSFSWVMNDKDKDEKQTAYRLVVAQGGENMKKENYLSDSGWVNSAQSTAVKAPALDGLLEDNELYYWSVATKDKDGNESAFSEPQAFFTSLVQEWSGKEGIWAARSNGERSNNDFVFLRTEFTLDSKNFSNVDRAVLSATARSPEPARQFVYTLSLNGESVGVGPSRYGTDEAGNALLYYNSYDVTEQLVKGENAVGVICYTEQEKSFLCQLTVFYKDGTKEVVSNSARDYQSWETLTGDEIFGKSNSIGTGYYRAYANNIDCTRYPFGFDRAGYASADWLPAVQGGEIDEGMTLTPSQTDNVGKYYSDGKEIDITEKEDSTIVDLGHEIVGGLHLKLTSPFECKIELRYGEQLNADGSVKYKMLTGNEYRESWTLKGGEQSVDTIDLMTYRYVEIIGLPVTLKPDMVCGIEIRTEWDESEYAFSSDNELLNDIYRLMCNTAKVTSQDLYVDSQSRERRAYEGDCVINMPLSYAFQDNYSVARFSAEYLYTHRTWPADYVLFCARMAMTDYMETGDASSVERYYDVLKEKTFTRYLNEKDALVTNGGVTQSSVENCILVDWPETERDGYDMSVTYNTVFNALAVSAYDELAKIADITGHGSDAEAFAALAEKIRLSMIGKLYDPTRGAFSDGYYSNGKPSAHYSQHATAFALACGIYADKDMADKMAAYIEGQGKIKTSVYGAFFLLEGLYASGNGDVANALLLDEDRSEGARTWAYMLYSLGATVTTEAWNAVNKDNMTFSHPWGAAPAYAITRGIFGIKPTMPGYAAFDIKFDVALLNRASLTCPTVRGKISASFEKKDGKFTASVTVPANTEATVYLPAQSGSRLFVDGVETDGEYKDGFIAVRLGSGTRNLVVE